MKHELVSHKKLQDTLSHRRFKVKSVISGEWCVVRGVCADCHSPIAAPDFSMPQKAPNSATLIHGS